jgi:hypothetical protein
MEPERIELSQRERDPLKVLHEVDQGHLTRPEAAGRLMFQIIGAMAEFERGLIAERVWSGMAAARARGARIGRARKPVDADKVTELRAQGASWRAVAREPGGRRGNCSQSRTGTFPKRFGADRC